MMVSAHASRLRLTRACVPAGKGGELEAAVNAGGGDWCLALKANQVSFCRMPGRASARSRPAIR